jgi:hypothetical protein
MGCSIIGTDEDFGRDSSSMFVMHASHPQVCRMFAAAMAITQLDLLIRHGEVLTPFVLHPQGVGRGCKGHSFQQRTHSLSKPIHLSTSSRRTDFRLHSDGSIKQEISSQIHRLHQRDLTIV